MRVVLYVCLLIIAGLVAVEAKQKTCPYTCGCSLKNKTPVCGASGRTHLNHCLARCYNDKIVKVGACEAKTPQKRKIRRTCRNKRYGNGVGRYCCTWTQGQRKTTRKCSFVGCITVGVKTNCYWRKLPNNTRVMRRYCCPYKVQKCGSTIRRVRSGRCHYAGRTLSSTHHKNCSWKRFGSLGKRRYCCSKKVTCSGKKKCVVHSKRCHFVGSIITTRRNEVCSWQRRGKSCRQMRCRPVLQRCIASPGRKVCNPKTKACRRLKKRVRRCSRRFISKARWVGKKLCSRKRVQVCRFAKYGKNGRRQRCCTYRLRRGRRYGLRCKWSGCVRKQTVRVKCAIKKNGKSYQRQCCTYRRICKCGTCAHARKRCRWVGKRVRIHAGRKCNRVATSNNTYQTRCCVLKKRYNRHTKLFKLRKSCYYKNDSQLKKRYVRCQWRKISRHRSRRLCVTYLKVCNRNKCQRPRVIRRRYVGITLFKVKNRRCSMKKVGRFAKQQYCCVRVKLCKGKGNCRRKQKCKFSGPVIRRVPRHKCHWRFYKNRASKKRYCCRWTHYCVNKKCVPQGKTCRWRGATITYKSKQVCKKQKVHGGYRRRCRTLTIRCVNSSCKVKRRSKWSVVGNIITTKYIKNCVFKRYGRYQKRKFCKRFHRKCNGPACKLRFKQQGWVGPVYTRKPMRKCFWKRVDKKNRGYLPYCCTWFIRCIGKCKGPHAPKNRQCKPVSKRIVQLGKKTKCTWRRYRKKYRRQRCCSTLNRRIHHSKPLHVCSWRGKAYALKKTYYRRRKICTKHQCCQQLSKCFGRRCSVVRNERCTPYTKRQSRNYCYSYGNSWVRPFKEKSYRLALAGDHNLVSSKHLTCHQRSVQWKSGLVTVYSFACNVNGDIVESISRNANKFLINKTLKLKLSKNQVYRLPKGGYIKVYSNKKVIIDSGAGYLTAIFTPWDRKKNNDRWLSLAVKVPATRTFRGMCSSKVESRYAKGLFKKEFKTKTIRVKRRSCSRSKRKLYLKTCKRIRVRRGLLNRCVFDLTRGMPLDASRYAKILKKFAHSHKLRIRHKSLQAAKQRIANILKKAKAKFAARRNQRKFRKQFRKNTRKGGGFRF